LPDVRLAWRDVWIGAVVTALLFTLGKYVIGLYLGNSNVATPFGAAGSLVILFVWIYYAAQILFLGAEITQVYANTYGSGIRPKSDAMKLDDAARVEQGTKAPATGPTPQAPNEPNLPANRPVPLPLYMQLAQPNYEARGPFNPFQLVGAAIGVHLFGWVRQVLDAGKAKSQQT
jgi:membrane protein